MSKDNDELRQLIERGFAQVNARMGHMETRFEERFAKIDERFEMIDERFAKIDERFAKIDERFDKQSEQIRNAFQVQRESIARMEGRLDEQSRILAALIPTTLAAVPPARKSAVYPPAT
ncbi:MAG: hypothetical protein HQL37_06345 [Alphaproteobacteria bacterium]|nr:hypothetical protein [Alphaproteobacteria bacterium]